MGGADYTFLSEATAEGGYGDYIVNKSQIISKTGGTNYMTGFAVRMPREEKERGENKVRE